jgi:hypothetical protein
VLSRSLATAAVLWCGNLRMVMEELVVGVLAIVE